MKTADIVVGEAYAVKPGRWERRYVKATVLAVGVRKQHRDRWAKQNAPPVETGPATLIEVTWIDDRGWSGNKKEPETRMVRVRPQDVLGPYGVYHAEKEKESRENVRHEEERRKEDARRDAITKDMTRQAKLINEALRVGVSYGQFVITGSELAVGRLIELAAKGAGR